MSKSLRCYNNIFITGMPGSGKTYFGKILSLYMNLQFIDFDDFFEKALNTKIAKIFSKFGLEGFREQESKILPLLLKNKNAIISLGGGTLLHHKNFENIQQNGLIVLLSGISPETLAQRIFKDNMDPNKRKRPIFSKCETYEQILKRINEISQERKNIYFQSDLILNSNYNSVDNLVLTVRNYESIIKKFN